MTWVSRCGLVLLCCYSAIRFCMLYHSRFRDNCCWNRVGRRKPSLGQCAIMRHDRIHNAHRSGCHQPPNFCRFGFRLRAPLPSTDPPFHHSLGCRTPTSSFLRSLDLPSPSTCAERMASRLKHQSTWALSSSLSANGRVQSGHSPTAAASAAGVVVLVDPGRARAARSEGGFCAMTHAVSLSPSRIA